MLNLGRGIGAIVLTALMVVAATAVARGENDNLPNRPIHSLSVELRPAYNLMSHSYFRGRNPDNKILDKCASLHVRYSFGHSPESRIGNLYPSVYQGIGIAAYTFMGHRSVGTPLAIYVFQGATLHDYDKGPSVGYEWNLGWSWGWVPNSAMNSKWNVLINVGVPISWEVEGGWELSLTPDFTHFSNGDTSFPNGGTNTFGIRLGAAKSFDSAKRAKVDIRRLVEPSAELGANTVESRLVWDLMGYGGWRADRFFSNDRFCVVNHPMPNGGLVLSPLYRFNRYLSAGGSVDLFIDTSANLYDAVWDKDNERVISYMRPPLWQQSSVGVSLRGELTMGRLAVGIGGGLNLLTSGYDMRRYYTTFTLKGFATERTFLFIGYRLSSLQYTHNIMYGAGIRF